MVIFLYNLYIFIWNNIFGVHFFNGAISNTILMNCNIKQFLYLWTSLPDPMPTEFNAKSTAQETYFGSSSAGFMLGSSLALPAGLTLASSSVISSISISTLPWNTNTKVMSKAYNYWVKPREKMSSNMHKMYRFRFIQCIHKISPRHLLSIGTFYSVQWFC